jgi:flagellar biosynthesis chaperone FliJ
MMANAGRLKKYKDLNSLTTMHDNIKKYIKYADNTNNAVASEELRKQERTLNNYVSNLNKQVKEEKKVTKKVTKKVDKKAINI